MIVLYSLQTTTITNLLQLSLPIIGDVLKICVLCYRDIIGTDSYSFEHSICIAGALSQTDILQCLSLTWRALAQNSDSYKYLYSGSSDPEY